MENLIIKGTNKTPNALLNAKLGLIELTGKSIPENPYDFYEPLLLWIDEYTKTPSLQTVVNIKFEYLNSSSSKLLLELLKKTELLQNARGNVTVKWYCEEDDPDMLDTAEVFKSIVKVPFEIIETV